MPDEQEMADYDAVMANKPRRKRRRIFKFISQKQRRLQSEKKALQDIQMDPNTAKDEELKKKS